MTKRDQNPRIFKNKWFGKFAKRKKITNKVLKQAISDANQGIIDADLGGGVIKLRIARSGKGKSGGYRTFILFRKDEKAFFVYGYAKSDRENIRDDELEAFRELAREVLKYTDDEIEIALRDKVFTEVK